MRSICVATIACHTPTPSAPPPQPPPVAAATFEVTSPAFVDGADIAAKFTCDGDNLAPPIWWAYVPPKTASIAVIVRDDGAVAQIVAGIAADATFVLPMCGKQTVHVDQNGYGLDVEPCRAVDETVGPWNGSTGWTGVCPAHDRHRYVFEVVALDAMIGWHGITPTELEHAIAGHVLARGSIAGTYARKP